MKKEKNKTEDKKVEKKDDSIKDDKKIIHPLIKGPRMTEKSALASEKGIYVFNVIPSANKTEIEKAIKKIYNVTPVKICITQVSSKKVVRRGVVGKKQGGKKAVVYLKKGDKITFV